MKVNVDSFIDKDEIGVIFIPTIVFCKDKDEKVLSLAWLFFSIEIIF